jgi:hypothetical protein
MTKVNNNITKARNILSSCLDSVGGDSSDLCLFEAKDLIQEIIDNVVSCAEVDFNLEISNLGDVRIISEDHIDQVWTDSLIEQIKDCYDLSKVPSFVEIDWEATAENCKVDGMGHHFNHYDGGEENAEGVYIFRTN